jgi:hypothetical protein
MASATAAVNGARERPSFSSPLAGASTMRASANERGAAKGGERMAKGRSMQKEKKKPKKTAKK